MTKPQILKFWLPLAGSWLLMSSEGPIIQSFMARLADTKQNLAAFGIAFSLGLTIEAPIIMLLTAAAALVKNNQTYRKVRNFSYALSLMVGLAMASLTIPFIYKNTVVWALDLSPKLSELTYYGIVCLIPWPITIGIRRFYQGVSIAGGKPSKVTMGTVIRIIALVIGGFSIFSMPKIHGVILGASCLSIAVTAEAVAAWFLSRKSVHVFKNKNTDDSDLSLSDLIGFYTPLALSPAIGLGIYPAITFFCGRSVDPVKSLAVIPVLNSFTFIFRSLAMASQEVIVFFLKESNDNYEALRHFMKNLSLTLLTLSSLIIFTPLSKSWFQGVVGLSDDLYNFLLVPSFFLPALPFLACLKTWQRSLMVNLRVTKLVTVHTGVEALGILLIMIAMTSLTTYTGAHSAVVSMTFGAAFSFIYGVRVLKKRKYIR